MARLGRIESAVIRGVGAAVVTVEVERRAGVPRETIVGLPSTVVRESLARVQAACNHSGLRLEPRRTTVNLAPAHQPKSTSGLDLPIALAALQADGQIPADRRGEELWLGELALDGRVRPVPGILPAALEARRSGRRRIFVPRGNGREAAAVPDLLVFEVPDLQSAAAEIRGRGELRPVPSDGEPGPDDDPRVDLAEIHGHGAARRALEIAAAGGHHLLLSGPPGAGKTLLARALPGLLPPLGFEEALEASAVHSVIGRLMGQGLLRRPPFRSPHHSITVAGLIGGGAPLRPGEASLAHAGVLFLDELPEFRRRALESLRQPLEEGAVVLARHRETAEFPCRFQLVAAMNPCPCGRGPSDPDCRCSELQRAAYRRRVSGPVLDRIDLQVAVERVPLDSLIRGDRQPEPSAPVRRRVAAARERQAARIGELEDRFGEACPGRTNGTIPASWLGQACRLDPALHERARSTAERLRLSARAWHRVLRIARTVADLGDAEAISGDHLAEAFQHRRPGRTGAG